MVERIRKSNPGVPLVSPELSQEIRRFNAAVKSFAGTYRDRLDEFLKVREQYFELDRHLFWDMEFMVIGESKALIEEVIRAKSAPFTPARSKEMEELSGRLELKARELRESRQLNGVCYLASQIAQAETMLDIARSQFPEKQQLIEELTAQLRSDLYRVAIDGINCLFNEEEAPPVEPPRPVRTTGSQETLFALRTLGLPANSTPKDIRKAFRVIAFKSHPDKGSTSSQILRDASIAFHKLKAALGF